MAKCCAPSPTGSPALQPSWPSAPRVWNEGHSPGSPGFAMKLLSSLPRFSLGLGVTLPSEPPSRLCPTEPSLWWDSTAFTTPLNPARRCPTKEAAGGHPPRRTLPVAAVTSRPGAEDPRALRAGVAHLDPAPTDLPTPERGRSATSAFRRKTRRVSCRAPQPPACERPRSCHDLHFNYEPTWSVIQYALSGKEGK